MDSYEEARECLAIRLPEVMKVRKVTIKELSEKSGISEYKLKRFINGEGDMMTDEFIKICAICNISADYLLGNNPYPFTFPKTAEEVELHTKVGKMEKDEALAFLREYQESLKDQKEKDGGDSE